MGTRTFDYTDPNGTAVDSPTRGAIEARLWQRETVNDRVRTIRQFVIPLLETRLDSAGNPIPDDDTTTPVAFTGGWASAVLSDTSANQCWVVKELAPIAGRKTFYKQISGDGPITDAPDVDPSTFLPLDPLPPSAQDVLAQAEAAIAVVADFEDTKGAPDGVASLDGDALLPESQVPARLTAASLSNTYGTLGTDTDGTPEVKTTGSAIRVLTPEAAAAKYATPATAQGIALVQALIFGA